MSEVEQQPERAWLIRAGKRGERDDFALTNGLAGGGFKEVGDLTTATTRAEIRQLVRTAYPDASDGKINNFTAQLFALRTRIQIGDLVVLPLKTTKQLAIGRVTGEYRYGNDIEPKLHHLLPVTWDVTDLPRTAVFQDLLYSLGASMTICMLRRNDAVYRLAHLAVAGIDPGSRADVGGGDPTDADMIQEGDAVDLEQAALDRIQSVIGERFAGPAFEGLVQGILEAEGYVCQGVEPGPDGGIDIFAGRGPLGLDAPRLIVQVKSSTSRVEAAVVRQLNGVLSAHGADQALLVAWGGVTKTARRELTNQFFRVRVWTAVELLDALMRNYERLDDDLRTALPLKQVWTLVDDGE